MRAQQDAGYAAKFYHILPLIVQLRAKQNDPDLCDIEICFNFLYGIMMLKMNKAAISKETLLLKVWGYDASVNANSVEAYVSFIRKKLSLLHSSVSVKVARNIGYRLEVPS